MRLSGDRPRDLFHQPRQQVSDGVVPDLGHSLATGLIGMDSVSEVSRGKKRRGPAVFAWMNKDPSRTSEGPLLIKDNPDQGRVGSLYPWR